MDPIRHVSPEMAERAAAFAAGAQAPAVAKGAATVVLLRSSSAGALEVYLLRRHSAMPFAAGMYAFPGGTVDRRDFDHAVAWSGPDAAAWGERLGCDEGEARALVCAAVRETFEESGVLFAGPSADEIVSDTIGDDWEQDRVALVDRSLSFTEFLDRRGLVIRTDLLAAWGHWITPEFQPRRYDTRFFVAALPVGQRARDVSGEADRVAWMLPREALTSVDAGTMAMLPPTYVTIQEVAEFASPREVLAAAADRVILPILPGVEVVEGQAVFTGSDGLD